MSQQIAKKIVQRLIQVPPTGQTGLETPTLGKILEDATKGEFQVTNQPKEIQKWLGIREPQGFYLPGAEEEYLQRQKDRLRAFKVERWKRNRAKRLLPERSEGQIFSKPKLEKEEFVPGVAQAYQNMYKESAAEFNWRMLLPFMARWPANIGDVRVVGDIKERKPRPGPGDIVRRTLEYPRDWWKEQPKPDPVEEIACQVLRDKVKIDVCREKGVRIRTK